MGEHPTGVPGEPSGSVAKFWWAECDSCGTLWRCEYVCRAPCAGHTYAVPRSEWDVLEATYLLGGLEAARQVYRDRC